MTAWGSEVDAANPRMSSRNALKVTDDPVLRNCLPPGTPRIYLQPFPLQFVQTPKEVIILYEYDHTVRHIFIDGRPASCGISRPPTWDIPLASGTEIRSWLTLPVLTTKTWLDRDGHHHKR